jgi:hypothetical protein
MSGAFKNFTIFIAVLMFLVFIAGGMATMADAGRRKPIGAQEVVDFVVGFGYLAAGMFIALKTYDVLK